jgi:hypothetical protein
VVTPAEAQVLLSMAASVDNRKPDPDAARAWAALLDGLPFDDCRDVVIQHLRTSSDWLTPAIIRAGVLRIRNKRIDVHPPLVPPPGLTDAQERAWLAGARRRIGNGEVIDSDAAYELVPAPERLRELVAAAEPTTDEPPIRQKETT